jgi:hypothetical protein
MLLGDSFTEGLFSGQRQGIRTPVRYQSYYHLLLNQRETVKAQRDDDKLTKQHMYMLLYAMH